MCSEHLNKEELNTEKADISVRKITYKNYINHIIKIPFLNVKRSALTHEIILKEAHQDNIDVVLTQEPYIFRDHTRRATRNHYSSDAFSPADD